MEHPEGNKHRGGWATPGSGPRVSFQVPISTDIKARENPFLNFHALLFPSLEIKTFSVPRGGETASGLRWELRLRSMMILELRPTRMRFINWLAPRAGRGETSLSQAILSSRRRKCAFLAPDDYLRNDFTGGSSTNHLISFLSLKLEEKGDRGPPARTRIRHVNGRLVCLFNGKSGELPKKPICFFRDAPGFSSLSWLSLPRHIEI